MTKPESTRPDIRAYRYYYIAEAVAIAIIVFGVLFAIDYNLYVSERSAQKEIVQSNLMQIARMAASHIDGDQHRQISRPEQIDSDEYKAALKPLKRIMQYNPEIKYIYTLVMRGGKVYFILDPTPPGDADGDGVDDKSYIMEEYQTPTTEMLEALLQRKVTVEDTPTTDKWGTTISGYAPFYNESNAFEGVIGVDIDVTQYKEYFQPIQQSQHRALIHTITIAVGSGVAVFLLRYLLFYCCSAIVWRWFR